MTKIDYSDSNDEQSIFKMGRKGNRFYTQKIIVYIFIIITWRSSEERGEETLMIKLK